MVYRLENNCVFLQALSILMQFQKFPFSTAKNVVKYFCPLCLLSFPLCKRRHRYLKVHLLFQTISFHTGLLVDYTRTILAKLKQYWQHRNKSPFSPVHTVNDAFSKLCLFLKPFSKISILVSVFDCLVWTIREKASKSRRFETNTH